MVFRNSQHGYPLEYILHLSLDKLQILPKLQHLFLLIPGLPTSLTEVHLDGNKITKVDAPSLKGLINLSK